MDTDSFIVYKKQKIFMCTLQKMLKQDLILQIINYKDHCLEQEIKVPSEKWMTIDNIIDPTDCFNEIKKQKQIYKKQKNIGGILKETEKFNEKNA